MTDLRERTEEDQLKDLKRTIGAIIHEAQLNQTITAKERRMLIFTVEQVQEATEKLMKAMNGVDALKKHYPRAFALCHSLGFDL